MKRTISFLLLFVIYTNVCISQLTVPYFGQVQWISGYAKEITGENIGYFSAYPDYATTALLTRCTDGNKVIEWETTPVPKNVSGKYIYFSWVAAHSSGTSKDKRNFDLYVNDKKLLTFTTYPANQVPTWTYGADDSSRIVFEKTKTDAANDAHGLAFLRLPVSRIVPGEPVKLKVVGQAQGSNDWYMTFKFSFEEKVDVSPMPFRLKNGKQSLLLSALHFGEDEQLKIKVNNRDTHVFTVKNGMNSFDIPVDAVTKPTSVFINASLGSRQLLNKELVLKPVVYRELYFIHHSHTDIGYSHLQPEVLRIHMKNIDDALKMIDATRNYPADSKFKWNIESLWVVENYLKQATPAQKDRFIKAVKEGSICLSGLYANILTGISEPEEVFHYTDYAQYLRQQYGVTINSAMISDIPGYAWTTVTGLAKGGIRYFSSGPNYLGETHPYLGDRVGSFVRTWGDKPVWWTSPSGQEKILFWTAGKGYSSWHGTAVGGVFDKGTKKIASYLNDLSDSNYPYQIVQWRYNVVSDNGPLDTTISRFVKEWNEKYSSPKIILSTTEKMFEAFEKKYGNRIPTVKGDITPYWEDGAFSTAYEEGKNRINSLRLQQLTTLYSILDPNAYKRDEFYDAWKNILLFHEHTWGAYNSTSEPDLPFVTKQWEIKKQFLLDADSAVNGIETRLMKTVSDPSSNKVVVVNTASWPRSGQVFLPGAIDGMAVRDATGKMYPIQKLSDGSLVFWAKDIPALGTKSFTIADGDAAREPGGFLITDSSVSNGIVKVQWDREGSIVKLEDNTGFNYAGSFNNQGMNSYWYVPGLDPRGAQSNGQVNGKVKQTGPVLTTIEFTSTAPGANSLTKTITLFNGSDKIFIENSVDKKAIREKESVHFGFPFKSSFTHTIIDGGYGSFHYLADQLPGSDHDYLYGRRWIDASGQDRGMQLIFLEAPLVEPGNMIDERRTVNQAHKEWKTSGEPTSTWFSYVMNNYWHTNYKADQEGVANFHYILRPHGAYDETSIEKAAVEACQPLIAFRGKNEKSIPGLLALENKNIVVTSITPVASNRFTARLFNPTNSVQRTTINSKSATQVKVLNTKPESALNSQEVVLPAKAVTEVSILF